MNVLRSLCGLALLAGILTTRASAQMDTVRVNNDKVNLRAAPSVDSAVVRSMTKGTLVTVVSRDNGWAKVKVGSSTGWVRGNLLTASVAGTGMSQAMATPSSNTSTTSSAPTTARATPTPPPMTTTTPAASSSMPAAKPMSSASHDKDGVRFTIFAGLGLNQNGETGTRIAGGFSLLFPVSRVISIGPEFTGFYDKVSSDAENSEAAIDAAGALLIRAHSSGSARFYVEAGPAVTTPIASVVKESGVSTTTTATDFQAALALGAGVQLGPLVIGAHYHARLQTGGGHLIYFTAGLSF